MIGPRRLVEEAMEGWKAQTKTCRSRPRTATRKAWEGALAEGADVESKGDANGGQAESMRAAENGRAAGARPTYPRGPARSWTVLLVAAGSGAPRGVGVFDS